MRARLKEITVPFGIKGQYVASFTVQGNPKDMEKYYEKDLDLEVKQHREKRSLDANAMLWACLGEMAQALSTDNWSVYLYELKRYGKYVPLLVDENAADDLKRVYRATEEVGRRIVDGKMMVDLLCFIGSSEYNTKEFSVLLDGVVQDMKEIHLAPPPSGDVKRALERWENRGK
jgi:hypothetical protein